MKREHFCFRGDCQSEAGVAAKDERMSFLTRTQTGRRRKRNELYYQATVSRRKTQIIITWSMVMIATCLAPLRLHQKQPITTFFFICNFHLNIFLFILCLSSLLVAQTNLERKRLLKDIYMRIWDFLFHVSALIIFFWMREFYGLEILDCCSFTEATWTLASSSFEWLICVFKLFCFRSLNSPRGPPSLTAPVFFFFFSWLCLCLLSSQFCSSALMEGDVWRASLRSCTRSESGGGTPGRRRNAILRNISQARRLDEGCSSTAQQEAFVEKGKNNPDNSILTLKL